AIRRRMIPLWRWTIGPVLVAGAWLATLVWRVIAPFAAVLRAMNPYFSRFLSAFTTRVYAPVLRSVLRHPGLTIASSVTILMLTAGVLAAGIVRWEFFPKFDVPRIEASITYPDGTPAATTEAAVRQLKDALSRVSQR